MTITEAQKAIEEIPVGSKIQVVKNNGDIIELRLASHAVEEIESQSFGEIVVPKQPPAIIVIGSSRFGQFRLEIEELLKIAWIEN